MVNEIKKMKKYFYCKKCKEFPDEIEEEYPEPVIEKREWDGGKYGLVESNIDSIELIRRCGKCGEKLVFGS
ncbi:MAG: hypothetical protein H8D45_26505 [Bacteroidetes bacterium]|nr:hypothetical protein [Bacteroidota bacterium]